MPSARQALAPKSTGFYGSADHGAKDAKAAAFCLTPAWLKVLFVGLILCASMLYWIVHTILGWESSHATDARLRAPIPPLLVAGSLLLGCVVAVHSKRRNLALDNWENAFIFSSSVLLAWGSSTLTKAVAAIGPSTVALLIASFVMKLALSLALWRAYDGSFQKLWQAACQGKSLFGKYVLLAFIFALADLLRMRFIQQTNPSTYHVLINFRAIILVFIWERFVGNRLHMLHWIGLLFICAGCVAKEYPHLSGHHDVGAPGVPGVRWQDYGLLVGVFFCSSIALAVNEVLLKQHDGSPVNLQNMMLYSLGLGYTIVIPAVGMILGVKGMPTLNDFVEQLPLMFHPLVASQVLVFSLLGIVCSHLLKRLSNVTRELQVAMEVLLAMQTDVVLFGVHLGFWEIAGASSVLFGIGLFSSRHLEQQMIPSAEEPAEDMPKDGA